MDTRRLSRRLPAFLFLVCTGLGACASGGYYKVSAEEFLRLAGGGPASAWSHELIGVTGSRVYLLSWCGLPSSVGGGEDIYSCDLAELPVAIRDQLRAGVDPWRARR